MLELKDVMLFISEEHVLSHLSVVAQEGEVTCLTGAAAPVVLRAMMGFVLPREGCISIDGEPLTPESAETLRQLMAYVPPRLEPIGTLPVYEPPVSGNLLVLAEQRDSPILLVNSPLATAEWLRRMADTGKVVIVASQDARIIESADQVLQTN